MKKARICSALLAGCIGFASVPAISQPIGTAVTANAAESSGTLGANLTWSLSDSGTLRISGTGDMPDYTLSTQSPF